MVERKSGVNKASNPNVLREVRIGQWSISLWKPRMEGRKEKVRIRHGYKPQGSDWVDQNIWCFENQLDGLIAVLTQWKEEK